MPAGLYRVADRSDPAAVLRGAEVIDRAAERDVSPVKADAGENSGRGVCHGVEKAAVYISPHIAAVVRDFSFQHTFFRID